MHLLVDARPAQKKTAKKPASPARYAARCGTTRAGMTVDLSAWASDVTCEACRG